MARIFDIPGSTIQSTCILKKYNEFGSVENSPKPFTQRDGTQYSRLVKLNRKKIITGDYYYDITLSVPKTVKREILKLGYKCRVVKKTVVVR